MNDRDSIHETAEGAMNRTDETHFGFRTVASEAKSGLVRDVFDSVAGRYDLMNDLMSGGQHRLWKASLIDELKPRDGMQLLDVAGGTGDIAFRFLEALRKRGKAGNVTVLDMNESMLSVGRRRAIDRGHLENIEWTCGNAEALPLPDCSVDAYTIAFGIRNVTHIDRAIAEAWRVLRPGGHFLCLEFSHAALPGLAEPYNWYSFNVIPAIGGMVTNDRESYAYLVESIRRFPAQEKFSGMLRERGFARVRHRNMTGGVVAIHSGWRL